MGKWPRVLLWIFIRAHIITMIAIRPTSLVWLNLRMWPICGHQTHTHTHEPIVKLTQYWTLNPGPAFTLRERTCCANTTTPATAKTQNLQQNCKNVNDWRVGEGSWQAWTGQIKHHLTSRPSPQEHVPSPTNHDHLAGCVKARNDHSSLKHTHTPKWKKLRKQQTGTVRLQVCFTFTKTRQDDDQPRIQRKTREKWNTCSLRHPRRTGTKQKTLTLAWLGPQKEGGNTMIEWMDGEWD